MGGHVMSGQDHIDPLYRELPQAEHEHGRIDSEIAAKGRSRETLWDIPSLRLEGGRGAKKWYVAVDKEPATSSRSLVVFEG